MKIIALAFSLMIGVTAHGGELTVTSPDKRYSIIFRHSKGESVLPVIFLRETLNGYESKLFEYASSLGQAASSQKALWSPDSHHFALTIVAGKGTMEVVVYRLRNDSLDKVEILPLPKAIDTEEISFPGSPSADRWEDIRTLWISDSSKNRCFRYRLTKNRKMLADAFEEFPKKPAKKTADDKTPETPQSSH
jgi:hypothetical protein